ncbi:UNVERIFIED_CONTAM: hypothetical protein Sangu_1718400 [Sesamum angustifolium]|uniref:Uncharacterized protein n=1 Tax=Sesamum angustifolium TaxID=2727405 RepID=A0AAW2MJL5_9LAMI
MFEDVDRRPEASSSGAKGAEDGSVAMKLQDTVHEPEPVPAPEPEPQPGPQTDPGLRLSLSLCSMMRLCRVHRMAGRRRTCRFCRVHGCLSGECGRGYLSVRAGSP